MLSIIVAIADNNVIGKNNQLLWHLPEDLKRFKRLTKGHKIIMGKNTWFSLPKRPLPDRIHIVLSDDTSDDFEGCEMAYSIEDVIKKCNPDEECFVIGGGMIYKQFLTIADKLYITRVYAAFDGDTFFPHIDTNIWIKIDEEGKFFDQEANMHFSYLTYRHI